LSTVDPLANPIRKTSGWLKWQPDHLSYLALVCAILYFCQDLVLDQQLPVYRDLTNYFYPLRYSLYESFRSGELPLWDRHFAQGFPNLAAFQSGVFYPPHLSFLFLPFFAALRVLFVLHFLIAALGTYALLRSWRYSRDLSLLGALLFSLGGVIVSLTNLLNHFQSAVWLPWLVVAWESLLLAPRWILFVRFMAVAALQFLAGSPEMFAMSMTLALLDAFRLRSAEPKISSGRILAFALAGNGTMLLLVMAQILPTAELIVASRRGESLPTAEALMWSLRPSSLLNLFFLDKEVDLTATTGLRLYFARTVPLLTSHYVGLLSLFGSALWVCYAPRREKLFLTAAVLGSLAIALGEHALIYPMLFRYIPFLTAFRFPEKFFFLTHGLVFFMTMRGLCWLWLDHSARWKKAMIILGMICFGWLAIYLILRFRSRLIADLIVAHSDIPAFTELHANVTVAVLASLQRQLILSIALFFLLISRKADKIRPALFSAMVVAVVFVDLSWAHRSYLFAVDPDRFSKGESIMRPADTNLTRFFYYPAARDLHPAFFSVLGQPTFEQSVALAFQNHLPNVGVLHGIDYFQEIDALSRRPYNDFLAFANVLDFDRQVRLLRTFNVQYLVSFRELRETGVHLIKRFPDYYSWLYRVENTVPRAYMVNAMEVEKQPLRVLERLSQREFDPLRKVVLDSAVAIRFGDSFEARLEFERYDHRQVRIRASSAQDAILVLADSYYPGWKAYVDGQETTILRANQFFRAIVLPKGVHGVEFRYEPWSFRLGCLISTFTLTGILVISCSVFLCRRKVARANPLGSVQILPH
jgi:hypothetical protein